MDLGEKINTGGALNTRVIIPVACIPNDVVLGGQSQNQDFDTNEIDLLIFMRLMRLIYGYKNNVKHHIPGMHIYRTR